MHLAPGPSFHALVLGIGVVCSLNDPRLTAPGTARSAPVSSHGACTLESLSPPFFCSSTDSLPSFLHSGQWVTFSRLTSASLRFCSSTLITDCIIGEMNGLEILKMLICMKGWMKYWLQKDHRPLEALSLGDFGPW